MRVVRGGFRVGVTLFAGLALALLSGGTVFSCGGSSSGAGVSGNCSINSDCDNPLTCAFGRCHNACTDSRDCPANERCVASAGGGVCQLSQESTCSAAMLCQTGEVCGGDGQCRAACGPSLPCLTGDYCLTSNAAPAACYSPSDPVDVAALMAAGVLGGDGAVLTDGSGGVIPADGSMGGDGAGGGNEGGGSNDANGGPDVPVNTCPSAQTQFGNTAQGDANASFTSGVGVRTASALLIFSGYVGPDPDAGAPIDGGDAGTVNLVYVQAFDPTSANSLGPAQPLFTAPDGLNFQLLSASVAPTGQIALAFAFGPPYSYGAGSNQTSLYAAFLAASPDAGAAGVALSKTVQLEAAELYGQTHLAWSVATGAFVFSWEYNNGGPWFVATKSFSPNGVAGVGTDPVPTDDTGDGVNSGDVDQGSVGVGPTLSGVAYKSINNDFYLTILDTSGSEVGTPVQVYAVNNSWVTVGAVAGGFVVVYDSGTSVSESFVPTAGDAGALPVGDAGLAGFTFTGAIHGIDARAINDDTGGQGGVGVALLYSNGLSFAYVNADGTSHLGPSSVIPHTYVAGDLMNINNVGGSFGVSIYSSAAHSTQVAASGCTP